MKRLVINADDFGLTAGVTAGIVEAMLHGVVSSTTAMVCLPQATENIQRFAEMVRGRIGLHLQLTDGSPRAALVDVGTLINRDGKFPRSWRDLHSPDPDEIRHEWQAQMETILGLGIRPTHIDTHHHVHRVPAIFNVYAEMVGAYGLSARALTRRMANELRSRGITCADYCEIRWPGGRYEPEEFLAFIAKAFASLDGDTTIELMCHPGFYDEMLTQKTSYARERHDELRALCDSRLRAGLAEMGIEVIPPSLLAAQVARVEAGFAASFTGQAPC